MRIVKLSKYVFGFDTIDACRAFFKKVADGEKSKYWKDISCSF